jgi:hypothetical protein
VYRADLRPVVAPEDATQAPAMSSAHCAGRYAEIVDREGPVMTVTFPGESAEHRAAQETGRSSSTTAAETTEGPRARALEAIRRRSGEAQPQPVLLPQLEHV